MATLEQASLSELIRAFRSRGEAAIIFRINEDFDHVLHWTSGLEKDEAQLWLVCCAMQVMPELAVFVHEQLIPELEANEPEDSLRLELLDGMAKQVIKET